MHFPRTNTADLVRGAINSRLGDHGCLSYEWLQKNHRQVGILHQADLRLHAKQIGELLSTLPDQKPFQNDRRLLQKIQQSILRALNFKKILYPGLAMYN